MQRIKDSNAYLVDNFVTVRILDDDMDKDMYKYLKDHSNKIVDVEMANMEKQETIPASRIPEDIRKELYNKFGKYLNKDEYENFYLIKYDNYISVFIGKKDDNGFLKDLQKYVKDQEESGDKADDEMMVEKPKQSKSEENSKESEEGSKESEEGSKESEENSKESEEGSKESEEGSKESEEGSKESDEETKKELIKYFKKQGSKNPEKDAEEYLKGVNEGNPNDVYVTYLKKMLTPLSEFLKESLRN